MGSICGYGSTGVFFTQSYQRRDAARITSQAFAPDIVFIYRCLQRMPFPGKNKGLNSTRTRGRRGHGIKFLLVPDPWSVVGGVGCIGPTGIGRCQGLGFCTPQRISGAHIDYPGRTRISSPLDPLALPLSSDATPPRIEIHPQHSLLKRTAWRGFRSQSPAKEPSLRTRGLLKIWNINSSK